MNIRDIEYMWKVASNNPNHDSNWHDPVVVKFAKLVADKEREACIAHAMTSAEKAIDVAIKLEREACAKVCDEYAIGLERNYSEIIADKIRARGKND